MESTAGGIAGAIDRFNVAMGRLTAWLTLLMVIVTCVVVVLRYAFGIGIVWLQESVTWMHAAVFMLGAAYTLQHDEHVRVDVFYREMSVRRRALVDLFGVSLFVLPLTGFLVYVSYDYVAASWSVREVSRESGGLPYPFVPILKSMLILMPVTVFLQGLSMWLQAAMQLRKR